MEVLHLQVAPGRELSWPESGTKPKSYLSRTIYVITTLQTKTSDSHIIQIVTGKIRVTPLVTQCLSSLSYVTRGSTSQWIHSEGDPQNWNRIRKGHSGSTQ